MSDRSVVPVRPGPATAAGPDPDAELGASRRRVQLLAVVTMLVAAWVVFSPSWFLLYPLTVRARDAGLWQSGPGLVALALAAARMRAPLGAWRSAVALVPVAAFVTALPFLLGWSRATEVDVAWWNALLSGGALTLCAVAGLVQLVRRA